MMAIIGTLAFNFQVVFPLFATRDLRGGDSTFTLLFSVMSVGSLVGALRSARRHDVDVRAVAVATLGSGRHGPARAVADDGRLSRWRCCWAWPACSS